MTRKPTPKKRGIRNSQSITHLKIADLPKNLEAHASVKALDANYICLC